MVPLSCPSSRYPLCSLVWGMVCVGPPLDCSGCFCLPTERELTRAPERALLGVNSLLVHAVLQTQKPSSQNWALCQRLCPRKVLGLTNLRKFGSRLLRFQAVKICNPA